MRRAFEHAEELYSARNLAQMFITTHSPAIYGLAVKDPGLVQSFSAVPDSVHGTQLLEVSADSVSAFDENLGIMPVIAPYISEKVRELEVLKSEFIDLSNNVAQGNRPLVIVAGETDVTYLKCAMEIFDPPLASAVDVICVGAQGVGGSIGAGDSKLFSLFEHFEVRQEILTRRAVFCLDCDVRRVPDVRHPQIRFVKFVRNDGNNIAICGVENLLPERCFLPDFYRKKSEDLQYGGRKEVVTLDKAKMASGICMPDGILYDDRKDLLQLFQPAVRSIREAIS